MKLSCAHQRLGRTLIKDQSTLLISHVPCIEMDAQSKGGRSDHSSTMDKFAHLAEYRNVIVHCIQATMVESLAGPKALPCLH